MPATDRRDEARRCRAVIPATNFWYSSRMSFESVSALATRRFRSKWRSKLPAYSNQVTWFKVFYLVS